MSGPDVSIIIPVQESDKDLNGCLDGVCSQGYDAGQIEILLIGYGGGPLPDIRDVGVDLRMYNTDHASPYAARNLGAANARGDILVFTEPSCRPETDWVGAHVRRLDASSASISVGMVAPERMTRTLEMFSAYEDTRDEWVFSGTNWRYYFGRPKNMAVTRAIFETHGPFHVVARGADSELVQQVARDLSCDQIQLAPDAVVRLRGVTGFPSCLADRFAHSRSMQQHRSSHAAPIALRDRRRLLRDSARQHRYGSPRAVLLLALVGTGIVAFRIGGLVGKFAGSTKSN